MKLKVVLLVIGALLLSLLLSGCVMEKEMESSSSSLDDTAGRTVEKVPVADINSLPLKDDPSVYLQQDPTSLVYFYITVKGGNDADGTNHSFAEVNAYRNMQWMKNVQEVKSEIIFQVGDEHGPLPDEIGFGAVAANATINVRGRTSTGAPQKSYRIDLFDSAGLWRGQRALALSKHPFDRTRLRNMLFFTLLQKVPDMTSLRTQFAQVFIKDETAGETKFSDYGLFTQVELPNGRYLRNHGLSRDGNLYKANMFEFYRYEDKIRLATDSAYDSAAFSEVLEPKTTNDHTKLIAMLDAVNDYAIPIEKTIAQHFNLDNVMSFLAYNLLMGNQDTRSQNFLLYSPVNSDIWYFLCWDGDGSLPYYEESLIDDAIPPTDWFYGASNYWGMVLFNRMLRISGYRDALNARMEQLRSIITPELIAEEITKYRTVVDVFTRRMPDSINLNITTAQLELMYQNIPDSVTVAYQYYLDSMQKPMPFFLGDVVSREGELSLTWGDAYDFGASLIYYDLQIATDWSFAPQTIVYENLHQMQLSKNIPMLPAGEYCWRVTARNESGKTQNAFDWIDATDGRHNGMRRFTITSDGEVLNHT